jgi:hypothetical protein
MRPQDQELVLLAMARLVIGVQRSRSRPPVVDDAVYGPGPLPQNRRRFTRTPSRAMRLGQQDLD